MQRDLSTKKLVVLLLSIVLTGQLSAQSIFSPLSIHGLGKMQDFDQVRNIGMGRLSNGFSDPYSFNLANPASMAWLDLTVMDMAGYGEFNQLSTLNEQAKFYNAGLGYFSLAIPLNYKKDFVSAISIKPYSLSGYAAQLETDLDYRVENYSFEGNLSQASISLAKGYNLKSYSTKQLKQLTRNKDTFSTSKFGIGGTGTFLFGNETILREVQHPDSVILPITRTSTQYFVRGFQYTLGAHLKLTKNFGIDDSTEINIGVSVSNALKSNVNTERFAVQYFVNGTNISIADTVVPRQYGSSTIATPTRIGAGIMYTKNYNFRMGADVKYHLWQSAEIPWSATPKYNYFEASVGAGYAPNSAYEASTSYISRIEYRAGLRYFNSQFSLDENRLGGWGTNIGFGLPILSRTGFSMLNLAVEYEQLNTNTNLVFNDSTLRFYLGITIREKWFQRIQID